MISDKSLKLFIIVLFITHHEAWLITSRECHSSIQYIPQNMTPLFVLHYLVVVILHCLIVVGISVLMMTSSNGNIFRVTSHLCGEFTGPPVNSPNKCQLMFSLICARINGWVNNGEAGDLRHHRAHYDVSVMLLLIYYYLLPMFPGVFDWHWGKSKTSGR